MAKWIKEGLEKIAPEILSGLAKWKSSAEWAKDGGAFIPMPMTWLNQQRWEAGDDLPKDSDPRPGDPDYMTPEERAERRKKVEAYYLDIGIKEGLRNPDGSLTEKGIAAKEAHEAKNGALQT